MKRSKPTVNAAIDSLRRELRKLSISEAVALTSLPKTTLRRFRKPGQAIDSGTLSTVVESLGYKMILKPATARAKQRSKAA